MTGDDLVHGWKEERMNGRMVPRRIMVFVFRLCLLGIILPSLWRENLTLRIFSIFFQLVMRWLGRWLQRWKDGTKTDNGICRNLVTLKMVTPKLLGTRLHRTQPFCGVQHFFLIFGPTPFGPLKYPPSVCQSRQSVSHKSSHTSHH